MTTLLALYRRPDGGPGALAASERGYASQHVPLVAATPGPEGVRVHRVTGAPGGETDLVLAATMDFADRASFDAAMASDEMPAAARYLRQVAPGLATLLILEPAHVLVPDGQS